MSAERHIPKPEEVIGDKELDPERTLEPLRCRYGAGTDTPCPRPATVDTGGLPTCDAHAIALGW
jgi:hypothetical protein